MAPAPQAGSQTQAPWVRQLPRPALRAMPAPALTLPLRESFKVQSAGQAPRARLRYALAAVERSYAVQARLRARLLTGGAHAELAAVPAFTEPFAVRVSPATGHSAAPAALYWRGLPATLDEAASAAASAGPSAEPYLARWRALLQGRRAQLRLDDRGTLDAVALAEDPLRQTTRPELDELTQRLLGLTIPLPEEPVGVGARWTVVTVLRQGLGVVKQTARYHLVAARDGRLTVELTLRRVGEEQRVEVPGLPRGAALDLVALFREVTGAVELELTAPLPTAGQLTLEARAHQRLRLADGAVHETITEDLGALTLTSSHTPPRPGAPAAP